MRLLSRFFSLCWNLCRELSDEAAYARYLRLTGRPASPAGWKQFSDRRYQRKYANAKCC